ncbi:MAG TPA: HDOD domain-containing protein [Rhodocyclaceae bacterium]|nr:HDOD domain-containing protein [Rhodocyclaceae bacterium]
MSSQTLLSETSNLHGKELSQQRFRMLADIAQELAGSIVFPVNFNVTFKIRDGLRQRMPAGQLAGLIALEPITCNQLLRTASKAKHEKVRSLPEAFSVLGMETVGKVAGDIANTQLLRCLHLANFSEWAQQLWERTLNVAAVAQVIARELTSIDPFRAQLAALSKDLGLYYMLYRAVQYEGLRSRPTSLQYLVQNWQDGILQSLMAALKFPAGIAQAVCQEPKSRVPMPPRDLGDLLHVSSLVADVVFDQVAHGETHRSLTALSPQYLGLHDPIHAYRRELAALAS